MVRARKGSLGSLGSIAGWSRDIVCIERQHKLQWQQPWARSLLALGESCWAAEHSVSTLVAMALRLRQPIVQWPGAVTGGLRCGGRVKCVTARPTQRPGGRPSRRGSSGRLHVLRGAWSMMDASANYEGSRKIRRRLAGSARLLVASRMFRLVVNRIGRRMPKEHSLNMAVCIAPTGLGELVSVARGEYPVLNGEARPSRYSTVIHRIIRTKNPIIGARVRRRRMFIAVGPQPWKRPPH